MAEPWESDPVAEEQPWEADPVVEEPRQEAPIPLSNVAAMKSGVAEMSPEARSAAQQVVEAIPQAISGAQQGQMAVMTGGGSLISEALTPQPVKDFMRTPVVPAEVVDVGRRALQYPLHTILFGTPPEEQGTLGTVGRFASDELAAQTTPENIGIIAGTAGIGAAETLLSKRAPSLLETLFGRVSRESAPLTTATTEATAETVKLPPIPEEFRTTETSRIGEPNSIEPSTTQVETGGTTQRIETGTEGNVPTTGRGDNVIGETQGTTERGQVPGTEARQGTEAQPSQAEGTVRLYHGGATGVGQAGRDFTTDLQYAKDYAAKAGEGEGQVWYVDVPEGKLKTHDDTGQPMTRVVVPDNVADSAKPLQAQPQTQGQVATSQTPNGQTATTAQPLPEIKRTDIPPDAIVQIRGRKVGGGEGIVELDARTAEGRLTKERSSYQTLLDCLGR